MAKIKTNKRTLIRWKVYIDRARMYIGYVQFIMIGFVLLESYRDTTFGEWIFDHMLISVPIFAALFIICSLIIGRLDTVYGFREEEMRNASAANPIMTEVHGNILEIKKELAELRKQAALPEKPSR